MKQYLIYTISGILLLIAGIVINPVWFIPAVVVSLCNFYWIWKDWKRIKSKLFK